MACVGRIGQEWAACAEGGPLERGAPLRSDRGLPRGGIVGTPPEPKMRVQRGFFGEVVATNPPPWMSRAMLANIIWPI